MNTTTLNTTDGGPTLSKRLFRKFCVAAAITVVGLTATTSTAMAESDTLRTECISVGNSAGGCSDVTVTWGSGWVLEGHGHRQRQQPVRRMESHCRGDAESLDDEQHTVDEDRDGQ